MTHDKGSGIRPRDNRPSWKLPGTPATDDGSPLWQAIAKLPKKKAKK